MNQVRTFGSLIAELKSVAAGKKPAPRDASERSYESPSAGGGASSRHPRKVLGYAELQSIESVARLLTPENRELLSTIASHHPSSVTELAKRLGRAQSNVSRTLSKLMKLGLVEIKTGEGQAKAPVLVVQKLSCEVDLISGRVTLFHP
ncbi:MAG: MarR family transcriptional regulator [Betaproteobacteria bacterium]|nr:MarR family transcriptional regulator [Betaproteobacteria bacterium]